MQTRYVPLGHFLEQVPSIPPSGCSTPVALVIALVQLHFLHAPVPFHRWLPQI
jgi:hypothetical protein